jgi:hypothetical protein
MLEIFQILALLCAALFSSAALYISVVEHPARMQLETRIAEMHWAPSYKRATWMQAPSALVSILGGAAAWLMGAGAGWLVAALLIGAVVPFTLVIIMPTNHALLATAETRTLLERWGRLPAVRSVLGLLATGRYLWLLRGAP